MDIGQLMRNMFDRKVASEPKLVELKVGEVVKGIVMKMLSDQIALVQIGDVPVRARLEVPLPPGQPTLLQVQPESTSGQVVLKPLSTSDLPIPEPSLGEIAKSLGFKNTELHRTIVSELHAASAPVTAKTITAIRDVLQSVPNGAERKEWVDAAIVAVKKGFMPNSEIVSAIRESLYGQPLGSRMESLRQALVAFAGDHLTSGTLPLSQPIAEKLLNAVDLWQQLSRASVQSTIQSTTIQTISVPSIFTTPIGQSQTTTPSLPDQPVIFDMRTSANQTEPITNSNRSPIVEGKVQQTQSLNVPASPEPIVRNKQDPNGQSSQQSISTTTQDSHRSALNLTINQADLANVNREQNVRSASEAVIHEAYGNWIKALFKHLGIDHEHRAALLSDRSVINPEQIQSMNESVKGLVMQLLQDESLPAALKESLQQTLAHITGQQLLLASDRSQMLTFMTMSIPINSQDGKQEATVQIQTRRDKRGVLDSSNCHLLFDLHMNKLGNLILDAQVADRIVSLRVLNDHPSIVQLVEQAKPDLQAAISSLGYSLLSMKSAPYPDISATNQAKAKHQTVSLAAASYRTTSYKGVDLRV